MIKFNPKVFTGKNRIERSINGSAGVYKIWVWNDLKKEYQPPIRGNGYIAHRKRMNEHGISNEKHTFETLDLARRWRNSIPEASVQTLALQRETPKFSDVIDDYKKNYMTKLRPSTVESYNKRLGMYFEHLIPLMMSEVTPVEIDNWISSLKNLPITSRRKSFKHEYDLLSGILKYYTDKDDDFKLPLKPRHRENIKLCGNTGIKNKLITELDFIKFKDELSKLKNGKLFRTLATVQFYQALRICEASALKWEDLKINPNQLSDSMIHISRSVFFKRTKGEKPIIQESFKNSKVNGGMKIQPLFQKSYLALEDWRDGQNQGLIFTQDNGELLTYRQIQNAYDMAFKNAGLSYSATQIMRHGGASNVYNKTNGDLSMVQSITGNRDYKSALVYAHRNPLALKDFAHKEWKDKGEGQ